MKRIGMYWAYTTRSLVRGGQRTLLAIFCVAVGVLAIVALQLVGNMVNSALTTNVQAGNGGDLSIRSDVNPLTQQQIAVFDQFKSQGLITNYTAMATTSGQTVDNAGDTQFYNVRAVNPTNFPIAGEPAFITPSDGSLASLLNGSTVVITDDLRKQLGVQVGDSVSVATNDGRTLNVTIGGIIANTGFFNFPQMLISLDGYASFPSSAGLPVTYSAVFANVPGHTDANAAQAKKEIQQALPLTNITTTKDALQQNQDSVQQIRYFLQIVGLLALLIGGVGIINTMQVLLRRRRTEIAMLKTAGYRRGDLYALFGLEAALLGLVGGIIGSAAGIGVSFLVRELFQRAFFLSLPAVIDPLTVASGVVIGFATALIFGVMPIVQASEVRPLAVLRELPEGSSAGSVLLSILLAGLLAVLFFALALSILQNFGVALGAVVGAGVFLLVLSLFFGLVVFIIGKMPVLERFTWWYLLIIVAGILVSVAVMLAAPAFGALFLALSLLGLLVVLLPREWKQNIKMALRNIGRQKARTVTTLVALFIGIFAIGVILALGQNIKDKLNTAFSSISTYNSFIVAGPQNKADVDAALQKALGPNSHTKQVVNTVSFATPVSVNGVPIQNIIQQVTGNSGQNRLGKEELISYLSSVTGYDLAGGSLPDATNAQGSNAIVAGRNLTAQDAGKNNVVMSYRARLAPLNLKVGDQIIVLSQDQKTPVTLTVVGFTNALSFAGGAILADNSVANTLSAGKPFYIYSLKLSPENANQILRSVQKQVPSIQTFSLIDLEAAIISYLNNVLILLTAIASLAMIAGIIIIANAVALAMLERRRELGILKSVGYTSRSVLGEVLTENGVIGFTGGLLAMLLVTLALTVLGKLLFKTDLGVGIPLTLILVLGTAAVCMVVAAFVAWNATRVRPLEVLRYE
ncbi:MAG: ABC transporter, fused permease protein [Ktedonobacterales bacterium]|jgi:predicted lysophospholipase L1 biosynthesis ABC-type transport system permease subunit|nr:MAG: ABC transporter, fused permease protein [Ktedonobacterales bacterium]